jgi:GR25 family glycosyltransferase involved in LPS biosynthesis
VQLLHKMVSAGWRYMMVLEDDAALVDGFTEKLQAALCSMPNNWAVFYLNACHERSGAIVGDNVRQFIDGSCLLGYVVTLEFALSILYERAPRSDRRFDYIVMRGGYTEAAYIADPPLLEFTNAKAIVNELSHTSDRPEWATREIAVIPNV